MLNNNKEEFEIRMQQVFQQIRKIVESNFNTNYLKQTQDSEGNITSIGIYANTDAEKKAFEHCFGVTIEEIQLISSLTEKQRKLILLQSQKENLEKEIEDLLKK